MLQLGCIHPSAALTDSVFHWGFILHVQSAYSHPTNRCVTAQWLQQRHQLL